MKKTLLSLLFAALCAGFLMAQAPQKIKYQAIARDLQGVPYQNQALDIRFTLLNNASQVIYQETHNTTTSSLGSISLELGNGAPTLSNTPFEDVPWENGEISLQVELKETTQSNYTMMGSSTLASVPYALYADRVAVDNDKQTLTLAGNQLSISNGNSITLPTGTGTQTLSLSGTTLSISGGNSVSLPAGPQGPAGATGPQGLPGATGPQGPAGPDAQTLSLNGHVLAISNGNSVTLPATSGSQTLSLSGNTLSITGGNSVLLPTADTYYGGSDIDVVTGFAPNTFFINNAAPSKWNGDGGTGIYNNNGGNVGIGTTTPQVDLDVNGDIRAMNSIYAMEYLGVGTVAPQYGLDVRTEARFTENLYCQADVVSGNVLPHSSYAYNLGDPFQRWNYLFCTEVQAAASGGQTAIIGLHTNGGYAGEFFGDVLGYNNGQMMGDFHIGGTMTATNKNFIIDHPLDPEHKYLYHACIESPDMMNVYNGNITTDAQGFATVILPDYFEALNKDLKYQLTCIGQFAQAIIKEKVVGNQFIIQTNQPNVEVSWQVTGVRQDAWAKQHPTRTEVPKEPENQGRFLTPEAFGAGPEKKIYAPGVKKLK